MGGIGYRSEGQIGSLMKVSGNWRLTFRFENDHACDDALGLRSDQMILTQQLYGHIL